MDPKYKLYRTHWFENADSFNQSNFADRTRPITFAVELMLDDVAPNGVVFEVGRVTHGTAIWLDSTLGTLGFCAGQGTVVPNDGVAGTMPLDHLGVSSVDSVVSGGTGYEVNDLITLAGGTFLRAAVLRVTGETGNVIDTVSIEDAGVYSVAPADPVAQDTVAPPGGAGATFNLTYGLTRTTRLKVVAAVIPCTGEIRLWVNGALRIKAQAASGSFNVGTPADSSWAEGPGAGGIGEVDGSITDRVPAGSQVAITDATIVSGRVSFYDDQRPQQFYTGLLV
jgi:hypothetical protein